jgi:hypothetical protein
MKMMPIYRKFLFCHLLFSIQHLHSLAELIEFQKLRKSKEGIDVAKLNKGNAKKKKRPRDESEVGGLKKGTATHDDDEYVERTIGRFFMFLIESALSSAMKKRRTQRQDE